ncbi:hypothetical protein [Kitasatospora sp. NPDC088346]|uniref:hypothetical protein n=1 Tax=Kitasatospora sp. NPDC088346 TaxID=3364073 RepID=UPI0038039EA6
MASRLLRAALRLALAIGAVASAAALPVTPAAAVPAGSVPCIPGALRQGLCSAFGRPERLGDGLVRTYARLDGGRPLAVGVLYPDAALRDLPTAMTDGHHCYDVDGDGRTDPETECLANHERVLALPRAVLGLPGMPLRWVLVNWNPMGHPPAGVYDRPHFDTHFYLQPKAERDAIRPGPCRGMMNCADYATATRPVPDAYLPADHQNRGQTEAGMGNHLPDLTSPEWHGAGFTRTFLYGSYDARITFLEPMVSLATLRGARTADPAAACSPVKQPKAWQQPGWYPRSYCVRYRPELRAAAVTLEDFVRHG